MALLIIAALALVAGAWTMLQFRRDMGVAYMRIGQGAAVVESSYGAIQFAERGSGLPVLIVHGSGGGYDQGELVASALLGEGFRAVIPSRFGYLGSALPDGADWDDQASAFAELLDRLGHARVAVVAVSHGGPSALMFARAYPERVASLTLVSCGVTPLATSDQAEASRRGRILRLVFGSDFAYWALSRLFERQLMGLMGADPAVVAALDARQRRLILALIEGMNPASQRSAGVVFDNETALPGERIAGMTVPTLIVHARDDRLQLFANAVFAAEKMADADLLAFERGGHLVMAIEQDTIRGAVRSHVLAHR